MSGTVNISRGIWSDAAFKAEPFTEREAFMWMIMEASYKARERRVGSVSIHTARGQLATSVRFMCEAWGWSKSRVDRYLKRLEKRDMIGTDSGTGINLITICKYDQYQNTPGGGGTAKTEERDSSGTAEGQQRDKHNKGLIPEVSQKEEEALASLSPCDDAKPFDEISEAVAAYNATAEEAGWPKVQKVSPKRRTALKARLRDAGGLDGWKSALAKARASPHCCGQNARGWVASFDFLTTQSSFFKLMEGNYDDRTPRKTHGNDPESDPTLRAIFGAAGAF